MTLSEIIILAKQGYKKKDIDELLKLDTEPEKTEEVKESKEEPEETDPETKTDKPDYEFLFNELSKKYDETAEALKKAQSANRKDQTGHTEKSDEDIALEHFNKILR